MAKAPGHQFGQLVGNMVEEIVYSALATFAKKYGYYLDKQGPRGKAREGSKVTWCDIYDCEHDLDFVIEKDGTADVRGRPLAFIETAWRRYTKHSKNKVQEIQGAILPTAEKNWKDRPFLDVVLVGIFTSNAIEQMTKSGFEVLYIHRSAIIQAFKGVGIAIDFDEDTPDKHFRAAVRALNELSHTKREKLKNKLQNVAGKDFDNFISKLEAALSRKIEKIVISPLFGEPSEFTSIESARLFLEGKLVPPESATLVKIDVCVFYNNGAQIKASYPTAGEALALLDYVAK
jgi:hypothetical protein